MNGDGLSEQGMPAVLGAGLAWSALSWLLHTSPFGRDKGTASLVYHFSVPAGWAEVSSAGSVSGLLPRAF